MHRMSEDARLARTAIIAVPDAFPKLGASGGLIFGSCLIAVRRGCAAGDQLFCYAGREDGERGERSKTAPADRLSNLCRYGHELGVEQIAAARRKFEAGALHVAASDYDTGQHRDHAITKKAQPITTPAISAS